MAGPVRAVAFDVLETLLELDPLGQRLEEIGQPAGLLRPWFLRVQRDAMALSLTGDQAEFRSVARQALRTESGHTAGDDAIEYVLDAFGELPAYADAEPALRALADRGVRVGCLTVGAAETTERFLEGSGLAGLVDRVVTAQQAGIWKPAREVYHLAAEQLGTTPAEMALVAVHAWDCHGAVRAGCLAGWCSRLEGRYGDVYAAPHVTGDDLVEVVDRLCELH